MTYLPFVSDNDLFQAVQKVIDDFGTAHTKIEDDIWRNVVDPFSAVFDATLHGMPLTEWMDHEKRRQVQKSLQNTVGNFHQQILAAIPGWEEMESVLDIRNNSVRIIAEVKNKFNTTKGNHKVAIYDDIDLLLSSYYIGFTGYYVEIIPSNRDGYDKPFTPSDNTTHTRRQENPLIRVIDGRRFYEKASGYPNALSTLYEVLPYVVSDICGTDASRISEDALFEELFRRAYS